MSPAGSHRRHLYKGFCMVKMYPAGGSRADLYAALSPAGGSGAHLYAALYPAGGSRPHLKMSLYDIYNINEFP